MTTKNHNKEQPNLNVAVIGTGAMGSAISRRILCVGVEVHVCSQDVKSTMRLLTADASAHDRPSEAEQQADIVIWMLPNADITTHVMVGEQALCAMHSRSIWVHMATIGTDDAERLAAETGSQRLDVIFVDASVSGSRVPADTGQLLVLASGPRRAAELLEPRFAALGRVTLWLGPAGSGSRMKLVLNTWLAFQIEGVAEVAALAGQLHVSAPARLDALRGNPLASPCALAKLTKMFEHDGSANFSLDLARKDLDLATAEAASGVAPLAEDIAERWRGLARNGSSGLDVSAARNGLQPKAPVGSNDRWPDWVTEVQDPSADRQPVRTAS